MMNEVYSLLRLLSVEGLGHRKIRRLMDFSGSAQQVCAADVRYLAASKIIGQTIASRIASADTHRFAEKQLRLADTEGIALIPIGSSAYPDLLEKIHDPPVLLFTRGSGNFQNNRSLAIVGTREPSGYGRRMAGMISAELADHGIQIVSGFARGIDTCAHHGALDRNGSTLAVLGCGVDVLYPAQNKKLRETILEQGLLISEFPIGTEPAPNHFPRRNRIISGLTPGTLVIEAAERSGALITAYNALEQGREVFALPGQVGCKNSMGPHRLIKEGAKLIEGVADIFEELAVLGAFQQKSAMAVSAETLSASEKQIWDLLEGEPKHIDRITTELGRSTPEILSQLLSMELKNCVKQMNGMMFVRQ